MKPDDISKARDLAILIAPLPWDLDEGAPIERMPDDLNRAASMISKLYALLEEADAVIAYECFDRSARIGDINKWADEALERYENRRREREENGQFGVGA